MSSIAKVGKCFLSKPTSSSSASAVFVCHHPDRTYEYKDTKPVPSAQLAGEASILKVDSRHMITKAPNLEQLQTLTYTPARHWHQYQGKAKRRKYIEYFNDNVDRPGLTS